MIRSYLGKLSLDIAVLCCGSISCMCLNAVTLLLLVNTVYLAKAQTPYETDSPVLLRS